MFKTISIKTFFIGFAMVGSFAANAQNQHHAKHNMLLFGTEEVFADHIVYKVPHNYQVILRVNFDSDVKQAYLNAKENYPNDTFIFLLDSMDIARIVDVENISGTILRRDSLGQQETIKANVILERGHFNVLYFTEIPLSLEKVASVTDFPTNHVLMSLRDSAEKVREHEKLVDLSPSPLSSGATDHWNTAVVQGRKNGILSTFYGGACDGEIPNAVSIALEKCRIDGFSDCRLVNSWKSSAKCY